MHDEAHLRRARLQRHVPVRPARVHARLGQRFGPLDRGGGVLPDVQAPPVVLPVGAHVAHAQHVLRDGLRRARRGCWGRCRGGGGLRDGRLAGVHGERPGLRVRGVQAAGLQEQLPAPAQVEPQIPLRVLGVAPVDDQAQFLRAGFQGNVEVCPEIVPAAGRQGVLPGHLGGRVLPDVQAPAGIRAVRALVVHAGRIGGKGCLRRCRSRQRDRQEGRQSFHVCLEVYPAARGSASMNRLQGSRRCTPNVP